MLLRTVFIAAPGPPGLGSVTLPLECSVGDGVRVSLYQHEDGRLRVAVDRSVDPSEIEVVLEGSGWFEDTPEGERKPLPRLRLRSGMPGECLLVDDFVSALTFLTDVPMSLSRPPFEDAFVAETDDDVALLERFGTDQPFWETSVQTSSRTFTAAVDSDAVQLLLARAPGLRIYADAMKLPLAVARFRELWRVLESAFALIDDKLVDRLAAYPPATQLGFNRDELDALRGLRGRASHAQSRAGAGKQELVNVERECTRSLPRLKTLVERVILTKKSWGYRTSGVQELTPVQAYARSDGGLVLVKGTRSKEDAS